MNTVTRPLSTLASWLGGWSRVLLLVLVIGGVLAGLQWERWRHPPVPEGAAQVVSALNADIRQTTYRYAGTPEQLKAFYDEALRVRGWSYCGTQATPGCTNLTVLVDRPGEAVEVYRHSDDAAREGATVEIWPISTEGGQLFVTVYETRGG